MLHFCCGGGGGDDGDNGGGGVPKLFISKTLQSPTNTDKTPTLIRPIK